MLTDICSREREWESQIAIANISTIMFENSTIFPSTKKICKMHSKCKLKLFAMCIMPNCELLFTQHYFNHAFRIVCAKKKRVHIGNDKKTSQALFVPRWDVDVCWLENENLRIYLSKREFQVIKLFFVVFVYKRRWTKNYVINW